MGKSTAFAPTTELATLRGESNKPMILALRVSDRGEPREFVLEHGTGIVGRSRSADVVLDDPAVSQFHVELVGKSDGIHLRDLGSTNGTWLGDVVLREARIPDRTEVRIGGTTIAVERRGEIAPKKSKGIGFGDLVGTSLAMRELFATMERIAPQDHPVLFEGDPGTGKTAFARALHAASKRAQKPLVEISCGAIPTALAAAVFEGEGDRPGLFEGARGGTLLLEEISELPRNVQAWLAGAIANPKKGDRLPRLVTTSRRGLRELVNRGLFQEELYLLLATARVKLPRLEERTDDIRPLAHFFLGALPFDRPAARAIATEALDAIAERNYPDNVKELRLVVERLANLAAGPSIESSDLALERMLTRGASRDGASEASELEPFKEAKRQVIEDFEKEYLERLLERAGTNVSRAASLAGIERQSLRELLRRHGLRDDG